MTWAGAECGNSSPSSSPWSCWSGLSPSISLPGEIRILLERQSAPDQFPDSSLDNSQIFKPGSGAWSKQFDKFGNLYYQFKCQYYDPQPDGTVKVTSPVIQFFLSGGQIMQIEGRNGIIRFAQGTDKGMSHNSPTEPPRYGSLRDVIVKLFNSAAQQNQNDLEMTMTMTNAQFDNDTYRLFTQEYADDKGKVWHEDEIPVTVSARDYSFNGSGLVLYWNDIDKRLKSLQIAHGTDLTLYDAGDLSPKPASPSPAAPPIVSPDNPSGTAGGPADARRDRITLRTPASIYRDVLRPGARRSGRRRACRRRSHGRRFLPQGRQ